MTHIVLITREECNYCDNAKHALGTYGFAYQEKLIGHDIEREEVLEKYPGRKMLPVVVINDECIGGMEELNTWLVSGVYDET